MRILVGGIAHESNTFNPIVTCAEDFVVYGAKEMLAQDFAPRSSARGIIDALKREGCKAAPLMYARAVPNGVVSGDFYAGFKAKFVRLALAAAKSGPVDGICLALHGSMKAQGIGCAEEDFVAALRAALPGVPLVVALDMHATITPGVFTAVDGFAGYKTAPHVDAAQTGALAARLLVESIRGEKKIYTARRKIPMLVAGEKSESDEQPMRDLLERCRGIEQCLGTAAASILLGFPWADDENNGVTILISTPDEGDAALAAEEAAEDLAREFWARREEFAFRCEHYDSWGAVQIALKAAAQERHRPVFLSDSGDNPTAGATGDATELLEELLARQSEIEALPTPLLYSGFFDAPAVAACISAGIGGEAKTTLGGNWDMINGKKIPVTLRVKNIVRDYGPYKADLALASFENILFVIVSKHIGFGDEGLLPALGIRPEDYCLVVVKLGYLVPCFRQIAGRAILALSKGCSNEALETIPYEKVRRPLFPLDSGDFFDPRAEG
ncbi:MAG: M81 family metallopeptidase [Treponema sp.]|nr:M81 family metallopeptidase [Treponema sp.]